MKPYPYSLRQLQYAVAVAETGGFHRAAKRCHVSQPTLSAQLALLEDALGVRLFERGRGDLRVRPFTRPTPGRTIILAWRRTSALAAPMQEFARTLRTAIGSPTA